MADQRVQFSIRIVDGTTSTQEATVSAAGNLSVAVGLALPAGTNNIGDIDVLTMPATAVEDAASAGGETGLMIIGVRNDAAAAKTSADGDFGMLALDSAGRVGVADLGGSITIDGSVSITGAVDTELPTAAALADAAANPTVPAVGGYLVGYNGTTWDRVRTANTGRLQVDVITGGADPVPTTPAVQNLTSAALAAGSSATLDTTDIPSKKLWQVVLTASVAFKAVISTLTNAVATTVVGALFGRAGETITWEPPHRDWAVSGSSAGADGFRVVMTNLDTSDAADVYAAVLYADN